jgi:thiol:disulfide interchange protein
MRTEAKRLRIDEMKNIGGNAITFLLIMVLLIVALPNVISLIRGPADMPSVFSDGYSLEQARLLSEDQGKPIFVLATADWCSPCQSLKRGPLQDPEVVQMIQASAIPVYLDDANHMEQMRALEVRSFPTTMIVEGGQVVATLEGGGRYKEFLRAELVPVE